MRVEVTCSFCGEKICLDLRKQFETHRCSECGKLTDMLSYRASQVYTRKYSRSKKRYVSQSDVPGTVVLGRANKAMQKRQSPRSQLDANVEYGSLSDISKRARREAVKLEVIASVKPWSKKLLKVKDEGARAWLASLLWWQLYSEIKEIDSDTAELWKDYIRGGCPRDMMEDDFIKAIRCVGVDERILTLQCHVNIEFPEHLKP